MKIRYETSHGTAEWVAIDDDGKNVLHMIFNPKCFGVIKLGNSMFEVNNGEVKIPLSSLHNEEYHPKLESDIGVFVVEGFCKIGPVVEMLKTDDTIIRRLISRCYNLEKACCSLEKKVAHLETMCRGHKIFDFERMEK